MDSRLLSVIQTASSVNDLKRIYVNEEEVLVYNGEIDCALFANTIKRNAARSNRVNITFDNGSYSLSDILHLNDIKVPLLFSGNGSVYIDASAPLSDISGIECGEDWFPLLYKNSGEALSPSMAEGYLYTLEMFFDGKSWNIPVSDVSIAKDGKEEPITGNSNPRGMYIYIFCRWMVYRMKVTAKVDSNGMNFLQCSGSLNWNYVALYDRLKIWVVNDQEELDKRPDTYSFYEPGTEQTSNPSDIFAFTFHILDENGMCTDAYDNYRIGVRQCLIEISECQHITFDGICFRNNAVEHLYNTGPITQAESTIDAAIRITNSHDICFSNCEFTHLSGYCIGSDEAAGTNEHQPPFGPYHPLSKCHNSYIRLIGNDIHNTYGGGIHLCKSSNCIIEDNLIRDFGLLQCGAVGILIRDSFTNNITHNTIFNGYYSGISCGWEWGYGHPKTYDNYIAYNHIHHCMRTLLTDGGGIYILGRNTGTIIENNLIHDIISYQENDAAAIYLDEGSSCIRVSKNLCYGCNTGLHLHYGESNEIVNNLFAYNNHSVIRLSKAENHLSFFLHNNIFVVDSGEDFVLCNNAIYQFNHNLLIHNTPATERRYPETIKITSVH